MRTYEIHTRIQPEQHTAVADATLSVPEIGPWLGKTYGAIAEVLTTHGIAPAGPPFARYHQLDDEHFVVEAGFPVAVEIKPVGDVRPAVLPGGAIAETIHIGRYDAMTPAYQAIRDWILARGAEPTGDPWEIYHSDPQQQPDPNTWRTDIVQPYRTA